MHLQASVYLGHFENHTAGGGHASKIPLHLQDLVGSAIFCRSLRPKRIRGDYTVIVGKRVGDGDDNGDDDEDDDNDEDHGNGNNDMTMVLIRVDYDGLIGLFSQ